ncbi:MAG: ATP-binding protein [Fibrobacterota bacterium]
MKSPVIEITPSREAAEVAIIRIEGELDSGSIENISRSFEAVLNGQYVFAIADMSEVAAISSAALGELMGCRSSLLDRGGEMVFAGLALDVKEKLTAMDANRIFGFFTDVNSALHAYNWDYKDRSEILSLTFPSQLKFVPPVRQLISRLARQKGYNNRDSFRIETIVDEVCNNAVEHGVQNPSAEIHVHVTIDRRKIKVKVVNTCDQSKAQALKELSKSLFKPKKSRDEKRGRGLRLIKMLSNDFTIEYSDGGTSVHVTKLKED